MGGQLKWIGGILGVVAVAAFSTLALGAGSVSGTVITSLNVNVDGTVTVSFANNTSTPPSCTTDAGRMVFQATTDGGKALLNAAMASNLAKKTVSLTGTGTCLAGMNASLYEKVASINFF